MLPAGFGALLEIGLKKPAEHNNPDSEGVMYIQRVKTAPYRRFAHGTNILPTLESKGYNAILVVVDRLSKCIHTIPTVTTVDSAGVACLFLEHVWRHHGLLEAVISDRGSTFISNFSRELAA